MPATPRPIRAALAAVCALASLVAAPAAAQDPINPTLGWQTITTPNFRIHFEPELREWAEAVAARIEPVRAAVAARVGYTPPRVIDIVIEDPLNVSNGSAWPSLTTPAMRFWATPPDPQSVLANSRSWSEILSVHEYAHLAHLMRPSRNRWQALAAYLSPVAFGPIPAGVPWWVTEGYATVIEGELTGAGRPNGVMRPAIIRQFAIEGALPSYDALDNTASFYGGNMRYLVGSAFIEWLQARRGDSSMVHLWRRLTAKQTRDFDEAFTGVFGEPARVLYGRFTAEVTAKAKEAERQLVGDGTARGTLAQRFDWFAGAPAPSPAGGRVAMRLSAPGKPTRIVVFDTLAPRDSADSAKTAKLLAEDSLDVADYRLWPKQWKRVATLNPVAGGGFNAPRWFRDGERLLVVRQQPLGDGRGRPDLWMWHPTSGWSKRITTGAGIREAEPLPSGATAVGLSCSGGTCGLVLIDLVTGGLRPLVAGAVDRPLAGVRLSPAGTHVATAVQQGPTWRPAIVEIASGRMTMVGPEDGVSRYAPAWAGDTALVVVSEAAGAANLERWHLGTGAHVSLTRTSGAVSFPDVAADGRIWFLDLHARGYELRSLAPTAGAPALAAVRDSLFPAAPRIDTRRAVRFDAEPPRPVRPYGIGTLAATPAIASALGADGSVTSLGVSAGDPLGRLSMLALAGWGDPGMWRGGRAGIAWRGFVPELQLDLFTGEHRPSRQPRLGGAALLGFDAAYSGGVLATALSRESTHGTFEARLGGTIGQLEYAEPDSAGFAGTARRAAFVRLANAYRWTPSGVLRITHGLTLTGATGSTNGTAWQRGLVEASAGVAPYAGLGLGVRGRYGVTSASAPQWERFTIGGSPSPFVDADVLGQRLAAGAVPFALRHGSRVGTFAIETTGPLRVFHEWLAAGETLDRFNRLAGAEVSLSVPPQSLLRLPRLGLTAGIAQSLDEPFRRRTRGWFSLTLTP